MSKWNIAPVPGLHDPVTGALVGLLGANGLEYMLPARFQGNSAGTPGDVLLLGRGNGIVTRNSDNATDTTLQILASVTVPGGLMGPNSMLRIWCSFEYLNTATVKNCRIRWGGGNMVNSSPTTTVESVFGCNIWNNNSLTAQRATSSLTTPWGQTTPTIFGSQAIDTRVDQLVSFACDWGTNVAAETISLLAFSVELLI